MAQRRSGSSQPSGPLSASIQPQHTPSDDDAASHHASCASVRLAADQAQLLRLSLWVRIASAILLVGAARLQQAFDTSHQLLSYSLDAATLHGLSAGSSRWLLAFVRWDTVYFLAAASPHSPLQGSVHRGGYAFEQTLAFQPGIVASLRAAGYLTPSMDASWSPTSAILVTTVLANGAALLSPVLLHRLTWKVTRDAQLAYTAALLSMLAPSAGTTLASPTPESFFSLASLAGMLCLEGSDRLSWSQVGTASFWFAFATAFRANGTLLVGYLAYKLISQARSGTALQPGLKLATSVAACISPNVGFQLWAYGRFCLDDAETPRPWCEARVPSIYAFVQRRYWNVGMLRYWEASQLPNFALAAPVLALIAYSACTFYRRSSGWWQIASSLIPPPLPPPPKPPPPTSSNADTTKASSQISTKANHAFSLATSRRATPYVLHGVALALILLFASHVQIALRLSTPGGLPMLWWGAAHAVLYSKWRSVVVGYLAVQYVVGIGLYAGFYPPA